MTNRSVTHATFTLERVYPASPAKVFRAFSDFETKKRWFSGPPDWRQEKAELDFRVGGREVNVGGPPGGWTSSYEATYLDIVPYERVVTSYTMEVDGRKISVSLSTAELKPEGQGTRLVLTEQGAYLDGWDNPAQRKQGTEHLLDALGRSLELEHA